MSGRRRNNAGNAGIPDEGERIPTRTGTPHRRVNIEESLPQWTVTVGPDGSRPTEDAHAAAEEFSSERYSALNAAEAATHEQQLPIDHDRGGGRRRGFGLLGVLGIGLGVLALLGLGAVGYAAFVAEDEADRTGSALASEATETAPASGAGTVEEVERLLQGIGYEGIAVEERDGTIYLSGPVESQADNAAVVTAAASLANGFPINTDGLTIGPAEQPEPASPDAAPGGSATQADPLQRLQVRLNRTMAATPVIFGPGTSSIASWHTDTLDEVAGILAESPGIAVTVVGYTDGSGTTEQNQALSEERTGAVRDYLIEQGLDPGLIQTDARGESEATGQRDVGYLERRVEFEVVAVSLTPPATLPLDVGIIVPSARNDLAFSQSLVDALNVLNEERGGMTLTITENMFDVDQAREQAEIYARGGADVVVLHGAQFQPLVEDLAQASPEAVFVVGPYALETALPNVFSYTIAAEQGAYVMGDLAASLSDSGTIGIVGPIPADEPQRFIEGFRLGAERQGANVLSEYVGSFGDTEAASAVSSTHISAGADVLTGTSQLTAGPIAVAEREGLLWFANQANQTSLAPDNVVASQVYHFEVAIREILAEIDANSTSGGTFPLTLGNGGMLLEFNPDYPLDSDLRRRADSLLFEVTAGSVSVDIQLDE